MGPIRDYAWLLVGAVAAVLTGVLGLGAGMSSFLGGIVPLPWGAIGVSVLVFAACTGLHFRLQLMRSLEQRRDDLERSAAASRLIHSAVSDGRRWLHVVQENLELVTDGSQAERERNLYLGGALANADKLDQAFDRIEGNQRQLDAVNANANGDTDADRSAGTS